MARDPAKLYPHDRIMAAVILPFIPTFVRPNHITIIRFLSLPFVAWFLWHHNYQVALPLFIGAALTDALDGSLARVRKQITRWGTFYDPVADKLLIAIAVLILVFQYISIWFGAIMLLMEGLIGVGGYVYRKDNKMQSANAWGKAKMMTQCIGVSLMMIAVAFNALWLMPLAAVVLTLAIALAIISLYTYGL